MKKEFDVAVGLFCFLLDGEETALDFLEDLRIEKPLHNSLICHSGLDPESNKYLIILDSRFRGNDKIAGSIRFRYMGVTGTPHLITFGVLFHEKIGMPYPIPIPINILTTFRNRYYTEPKETIGNEKKDQLPPFWDSKAPGGGNVKSFKYVVYQEDKYYVSQCLNVDVSSFGETSQEAIDNLKEAVELYLEDENVDQYYQPVGEMFTGEAQLNA